VSSAQLNPDNPKKEYTGVWIPKMVMECKDLSPIDKIVYGEIACFTKCYGSNKWLAERIGRSEVTASRSVNKLVRLGFVDYLGTNGNIRFLKAYQKRRGRVIKNDKAALSKMTSIDKSRDNNLDKMDTNVSIGETPETYGNVEINQLFDLWEKSTGLPITSNKTKNRYACNNLIHKYGVDGVEKLIRVVERAQMDKFAPRIADFCDLQAKLNQLLVWAKSQTVNRQVISVEDF